MEFFLVGLVYIFKLLTEMLIVNNGEYILYRELA